MKDGTAKTAIATGAIIACYAIYAFTNPSTDGAVFGTVMTALGAIGGYTIAKVERYAK
jgi:uncharacterized YccA/Bax inhibitor family protein